jgi:hypothetical protein
MGVKLGLSHKGKKHRLGMFESGVLRKIFEPKRKEVMEGWRRLYNEKFHNLYASPNQEGRDGWGVKHAWET